jgi:acetate kinase
MGTRSGDLDPGVILFLLNEKKLSTERLSHLLNQESGLLGISGISSDMKTLVERSATDSNAELAVEIFCYGIRKQVGSYSAVLGGIDLLVFTAGIGEHAPIVREQSCQGLEFLGIEIDPQRNRGNANVISRDGRRCVVRVIPTNEDLMIARHTHSLVS